MKNTNQCARCGQDLPPTGGCPHCTREAETSAILTPFGGSRTPRSRASQISTASGIAIAVLTLALGGAYVFHEEIANAVRGRQVADPAAVSVQAQEMVKQTLKQAGGPGKGKGTAPRSPR
jgi:hypothetical protein